MPRNGIDDQIRARVEDFVTEITDLVRTAALDAVQEAISRVDGAALPNAPRARKTATRRKAARRATRKTARRAGGGRVRRSSEDLEALQNDFLAYVRANPGERIEEISVGMSTPSSELKRPVQLLLADGKLRTEGQRRGTRYFAGGRGGAAKKKTTRKARKKATSRKKAGTRKAKRRAKTRRKSSRPRLAATDVPRPAPAPASKAPAPAPEPSAVE